jgi:hypothetical protein
MINHNFKKGLYTWPQPLKVFLIGFLFLLTSGVSVGIIFLFKTTSYSASGTIEHYKGSPIQKEDTFSVPDKYPKPVSEMLLTTHNHFIGFSFIFFFLGGLFYFNSTIKGGLKNLLLIEPFISTWLTFASIWGIRYIDLRIVYVAVPAALLTYFSFYLLVVILLYELSLKKSQ